MSLAELDDRTPAEKAYFESGGEKTEGLLTENAGGGAQPAEPQKTSGATEPAKPSPDTGAAKPGAENAAPAAAAVARDPNGQPVADEDETEEIETKGKKRRMVEYGALAKERGQRKDLEKRLAEEQAARGKDNEARARVDERLKLLTEAITPQPGADGAAAADEDPEPDPETDVFAHNKWLSRQLAKSREEIQRTNKSFQTSTEETKVKDTYVSDARRFASAEPNFGAAYQHLLNTRGEQLRLQGYDPKEIPGMIVAEERDLVRRAMSQNKSPAELIFGLAKSFGFQPKAAAAAAAAQPAAATAAPAAGSLADAAAKAAASEPAKPAAPNVADEIDRLIAGQGAAKSLSNAGGGSPTGLSLETLASLSDNEFASVYAKHGKEIDDLLGRRAN